MLIQKNLTILQQALDDTSLAGLEESTPAEIGQELTSEDIPEFDFVVSRRCADIAHCRDITYDI